MSDELFIGREAVVDQVDRLTEDGGRDVEKARKRDGLVLCVVLGKRGGGRAGRGYGRHDGRWQERESSLLRQS